MDGEARYNDRFCDNRQLSFGSKVSILRHLFSQTQERFGEEMNLHKNAICHIEKKAVTAEDLTMDQLLKLYYRITIVMENRDLIDPMTKQCCDLILPDIKYEIHNRILKGREIGLTT